MLVLQHIVLRLMLSPSRLKIKKTSKQVNCITRLGGWRVNKYADIKLPNELYQVVENQIVEIQATLTYYLISTSKRETLKLMSMTLMILLVKLRR